MGETYVERFAANVNSIIAELKRGKAIEGYTVHQCAYGGLFYNVLDREHRMALIRQVTEDYVKAHAEHTEVVLDNWRSSGCKSERPATLPLDSTLLERLADAVLDEELSDTHPDKVTRDEYPFMSTHQLSLRRDKETGLKAAEELGTDGRDYRKPAKRRRTKYENWHVDTYAKGRNIERQRQYAKDTSSGRISAELSEPFVNARKQSARWRDELSLIYK